MKNDRGFTYVELMIVVALIGVMAAAIAGVSQTIKERATDMVNAHVKTYEEIEAGLYEQEYNIDEGR